MIARRLIVQRQSPDWDGVDSVEHSVSFLERRLFDPDTAKGREMLELTHQILRFWQSNAALAFWDARGALKHIAHRCWRQVENVDEIIMDADFDASVRSQFNDGDLILFVDDDDWIAPDAFAQIEQMMDGLSGGAIWGRARFDGDWQWTEVLGGPMTVYTNNYAVRASELPDRPLQRVMQHGAMDGEYREGRWRPAVVDHWGTTITNKAPCSWNYMLQAMRHEQPVAELHRRIRHYAKTQPLLDKRVDWAADWVRQAQAIIERCLPE